MTNKYSKGRILGVVMVWVVIVTAAAMVFRWVVKPKKAQEKELVAQQEKEKVVSGTSAQSRYDVEINFAIDAFPGFAILRSEEFREQMAKNRIKVNLLDDGGNYEERIKAFKQGRVQMGVFTADALIKASANTGGVPPATIIGFVDETRGADAMVGYKSVFPNVDALNDPEVKFITAGGPSDTLCRVLISQFRMTKLNADPFKVVGTDAKDVFDVYRKSNQNQKQVYVLWEPWVSKILDNDNVHVIVDSSRFSGYIMDVIVADRDYLFKNPQIVRTFMECYFHSLYKYRDDLPKLLLADSKLTGNPLSEKEAKRIVEGVWFKNTSDNYAQMGLVNKGSLLHIEDMLANITRVLVSTKSIASDPTGGKTNLLYYDGVLKGLAESNFHPGVSPEEIRKENVNLAALTEKQWGELVPIGQLEVPPLVFARGGASLTDSSTLVLTELVEKLKTWPQAYILIKGNASLQGDPQANAKLALDRAKAAQEFIVSQGISPTRVHAVGQATGETSVNFVLGQPPY